jgi:hypothetical protein
MSTYGPEHLHRAQVERLNTVSRFLDVSLYEWSVAAADLDKALELSSLGTEAPLLVFDVLKALASVDTEGASFDEARFNYLKTIATMSDSMLMALLEWVDANEIEMQPDMDDITK